MNSKEDVLLERVKERIRDPKRFVDLPDVVNKKYKLYPPVSLLDLEIAERRLGFPLPRLLSKLYLLIGNGGFGPGYGLLALNNMGAKNYHLNLVDEYLEMTHHTLPDYPPWPPRILTVCDWGDGITSVLNANDPVCPVLRFHGDKYEEGPWEKVMITEASSLQEWIEDWLDNKPLFSRVRL